MQEIIELAEKLGKAIAAGPRHAAMAEARKKLRADPLATQLLKDFQEQAHKIARLEAETKPVEVADKRRFEELQQQIAGNDALKELMRVQADFSEMMNRVNHAIATPLGPPDDAEEPTIESV